MGTDSGDGRGEEPEDRLLTGNGFGDGAVGSGNGAGGGMGCGCPPRGYLSGSLITARAEVSLHRTHAVAVKR